MGFHYKFNASGGHRWVPCAIQKALEADAPKRPAGEAAIKGTATHFLGEWGLTSGYAKHIDERLVGAGVRFNPEGDAFEISIGPGHPSFAGLAWSENPLETTPDYPVVIPIDEDMIRGASIYTNLVSSIIQKYPGCTMRVEVKLELAEDMGGFVDCVIITENRIIIIDYKNGRGYVDVVQNMQLLLYAVGALKKYDFQGKVKDVVMCIVQPNCVKAKPVRTWTQTRQEIELAEQTFFFARGRALEAEKLYKSKSGRDILDLCSTGPHCKWCPSSILCPAMKKETMELVRHMPKLDNAGSTQPPTHPTDEELAWLFENSEAIKDFLDVCRDTMTEQALKGKAWPGFKLVEKITRRKLVNVNELAKKLKHEDKMDGFDVKPKALSKLEKLYGKDYMAPFVEKPKGTLELVSNSDPRMEETQSILASMPKLD